VIGSYLLTLNTDFDLVRSYKIAAHQYVIIYIFDLVTAVSPCLEIDGRQHFLQERAIKRSVNYEQSITKSKITNFISKMIVISWHGWWLIVLAHLKIICYFIVFFNELNH